MKRADYAAIDLVLAGSLRQSAPVLITFEGATWTAVTRGCMLLALHGEHLGAERDARIGPRLEVYMATNRPEVWDPARPLRDLLRDVATEWGDCVSVLDCDDEDRFNPRLLETLLLAFDDRAPLKYQITVDDNIPALWLSQPNVIASLAATTADPSGEIRIGVL